MTTFGNAPELTVPMSVLGYFGWTILGVLALAALVGLAALRTTASDRWAYGVSAIPALALCAAVTPYFRAAPPGWNAHHVTLWIIVVHLGLGACALARSIISSTYGSQSVVVLPGLYIAAPIALAKIWDSVNEHLASIPMSWGMVGLIFLVVIALIANSASQR